MEKFRRNFEVCESTWGFERFDVLSHLMRIGFYKFYSWDAIGCSCLISQMGSRAKFGKKLIHLLNVSVFSDSLIVVNTSLKVKIKRVSSQTGPECAALPPWNSYDPFSWISSKEFLTNSEMIANQLKSKDMRTPMHE
uniref:Uncharacterized protein n=1 Tax=Cucumis sativus TaxID=3659 RepID=A0A0A0K412_CUCSA